MAAPNTRLKYFAVRKMKKAYSAFYIINIIFQAIFTLVWQVALFLLIGLALVKWLSAPVWIYVPLGTLGAVFGFISMIRFVMSAMKALESIEKRK